MVQGAAVGIRKRGGAECDVREREEQRGHHAGDAGKRQDHDPEQHAVQQDGEPGQPAPEHGAAGKGQQPQKGEDPHTAPPQGIAVDGKVLIERAPGRNTGHGRRIQCVPDGKENPANGNQQGKIQRAVGTVRQHASTSVVRPVGRSTPSAAAFSRFLYRL